MQMTEPQQLKMPLRWPAPLFNHHGIRRNDHQQPDDQVWRCRACGFFEYHDDAPKACIRCGAEEDRG